MTQNTTKQLTTLVFTLVMILSAGGLAAAPDPAPPARPPVVRPASDEGQRAISRFRVPAGFKISLFAAEPMFANPVCLYVDHRGRVFVGETFRQSTAIPDNRGHMYWLDDDMAAASVEDRLKMYQKHAKRGDLSVYTATTDRITRLVDVDGDGVADKATIFADHFNQPLEGTGAGLLAWRGKLYYTCIPNLWSLEDRNDDGVADGRTALSTGYGVKVALRGHDMHGLRMGPDGRIYFSIGDRGLHVKTSDGRTLHHVDYGTVLRCDPDGSNLEVFAQGLRNPQELAFDQYGNLFTGDNNADGGDAARLVYIAEGGDTGWRVSFQYIPPDRRPWNTENRWKTEMKDQSAYLLPPIAHITAGPSGFTFNPGTGLPAEYANHFFLCDFRGGPGGSGVHTFAVKQNGAGYKIDNPRMFFQNILCTDADFGPDGSLYVSDWVDGWNGEGKGRIYKVTHPQAAASAPAIETRRLLAAGTTGLKQPMLLELLSHPDMRVRLEAQWTLAEQGEVGSLSTMAQNKAMPQLARLHSIWAMGQILRKSPDQTAAINPLFALLADDDAEVRAQAASVLGDCRIASAAGKLLPLLMDSSTRVQYFAALGLGKLKHAPAIGPIIEMIRANADKDRFLRHAGIFALASIGQEDALFARAADPDRSVRIALLVALRRLGSEKVARFLTDSDEQIVLEAAYAINDQPIDGVRSRAALASLIIKKLDNPNLTRRVINAHFRLGAQENARALIQFASRHDQPDWILRETAEALADWDTPNGKDRVLYQWRPLEPRKPGIATAALRSDIGVLLRVAKPSAREAFCKLAAKLNLTEAADGLFALASDTRSPADARVAALAALSSLKSPKLEQAINATLSDAQPPVRSQAQKLLSTLSPEKALALYRQLLQSPAMRDRQVAFSGLAMMKKPGADELLGQWVDQLAAGRVATEIQLDLLEAAGSRKTPELAEKLDKYAKSIDKTNPLAEYIPSLSGGDAEAGRKVFFEHQAAQCLRCHAVKGNGGTVGPDMAGIASRVDRKYLLESLINPSAKIAMGYSLSVLEMQDGASQVGYIKSEKDGQITLTGLDGKSVTVEKAKVKKRSSSDVSPMPPMGTLMSRRELRDLMEYLATQKN